MKKRFLFEVLSLCVIAVSFFILFSIQDLGVDFKAKLWNLDKDTLVDKFIVENAKYVNSREDQELVKEDIIFENCYYYSVLSEEEKLVYQEIFVILRDMKNEVTLSTLDESQIEKVFQCVLNDNPQFYYVEGYTYTTHSSNDEVIRLDFSGTYTKTEEECEAINTQIDLYTEDCFLGLTDSMSDYEKVKYIYEYIILNTEYNLNAEDSQNICSVFLNKESVCMGYARAMQYLLLKQKILCTIVNGTAGENEEHAWNLLLLDGEYYYLDVTWGDSSYTVSSDLQNEAGMVNYSFFCVTTDAISGTHKIESVVEMPDCASTENNYYVKEGYYFTDLDIEKLARIFEEAYKSQKEYLEIKCSDEIVYQKIYQYLIDEQHVFDYLENDIDTVSYYAGIELFVLEFWLK